VTLPPGRLRQEAARRAAKRQLRAQEAQAAVTSNDHVDDKLKAQRDFVFTVVGQALGELTNQLRDELMKELDKVGQQFKAMTDVYSRELKLAHAYIELLQRRVDLLTGKHAAEPASPQRDGLPKYDA